MAPAELNLSNTFREIREILRPGASLGGLELRLCRVGMLLCHRHCLAVSCHSIQTAV